MKRRLFCLITGILLCAGMAHAGETGTHGGDPYAAAWVKTGNLIATFLDKKAPPELKALVFGDTLRKIVAKIKVQSTDDDIPCKGIVRPACNYPAQNRILYNRYELGIFTSDVVDRLIFHEYLEVAGLEDENYKISNLLKIYEPRDFCFESPCPDDSLILYRKAFAKAKALDLSQLAADRLLFASFTKIPGRSNDVLDFRLFNDDFSDDGRPLIYIDRSGIVPQIGMMLTPAKSDEILKQYTLTYNDLLGHTKGIILDGNDVVVLDRENIKLTFRQLENQILVRIDVGTSGGWRDVIYAYVDMVQDRRDDMLKDFLNQGKNP